MPQVQVDIGGRPYRLACEPGDEERLAALAKHVDGKIAEMQGAFRDIADQRIVVMAALSIADELFEARKKAEAAAEAAKAAQAETAGTLTRETESKTAAETRAEALRAAVEETASRVEALTRSLEGLAEPT